LRHSPLPPGRVNVMQSCVYAAGFFRNKARHIVPASRLLTQRHGAQVLASMQ
jgi:endonuclease III